VAYTMENLLSVLHPCCPAEADALCKNSRRVSIKYCCSRLCFTMSNRRFPPPWSVEETAACFIERVANGQALAYVYYEEEAGATIGGQTAKYYTKR
jgi:hypothetical protein